MDNAFFWPNIMQQGMLFEAYFLCKRVQGVERFATHPFHFPSQVTPPQGFKYFSDVRVSSL